MRTDIDLSPEFIAHLKTLAQKATPEFIREGYFIYGPKHPASKHPNGRIFIANIIEGSNQRDPHLDGGTGIGSGKDDAAYIAAAHPSVMLALLSRIEDLEKIVAGSLYGLYAEAHARAERLEKEADWLAREVSSWEHDQLDGTGEHIREVPELREAARKAVEANND